MKEAPPVDYSRPRSYTPGHLARKILTTRSSIEGERKLVTVFFADVANFTSISEELDPEEVHQIMDGAFKILLDETHKYEGTINQFTGDGVMALFGAPVAHEDHAQRACHAALSIQKAMGEIIDLDVKLEDVIPPFLSVEVADQGFSGLGPREKRERTFETLRDLLIRVSQKRPLILVVEDLHRVDETSEKSLDYLTGCPAFGYLCLGRGEESLDCAEKGWRIHTDLGIPFFLGSIHLALGEAHLHFGNLEKALVNAEQAVELCRNNNERHFEAEAYIALGRVTAAMDRRGFDQARELILRGTEVLYELQIRPRYAVGLLRLGELCADAGRKEEALEKVRMAEGMFQEMGMDCWAGKAKGVLAAIQDP